jgi:squalene-hopene/tetraprenyl-beta-curcumene cyclase
MKFIRLLGLVICIILVTRTDKLLGQDAIPHHAENLSVRNEVEIAINKGLDYLKKNQNPDGSWSLQDYPALTGLALWAYMGDPERTGETADYIKKGYGFLLSAAQPDGGIYRKGLANYNTSISVEALVMARDAKYDGVIRGAHDFVVGQQAKGMADSSMDGGIGYGPNGTARAHPDLSNTVMALEAIRQSEGIGSKEGKEAKLDWDAAIAFIQRCQNLPEVNKATYVSNSADDRGGFIYYPGESAAGETGTNGMRSYGTMSYAGLLSYIYADLKKTDPRVTAAMEWLKNHYSEDGLFYYYEVMAKALTTYGTDNLALADGRKVNWPKELALKLIDLQQNDGSWKNESGRWMEKDPVLATAYAVLTLEMIYRRM